ncbi:hypothetical protein Nepgr_023455 [Nepenthes gracilis]|uniref:Uncharacterized protein n=1 Tax=Nepenthes gracilis TaxID=150966 RepID=A0AAD3XXW5_NEPGR|nr:hypothetical protein Nepgr_023455 [Nepenthes gracilis]
MNDTSEDREPPWWTEQTTEAGGKGLREEELAVVAVQERFLSRPSPDGDEEELENLFVADEIRAGTAVYASRYAPFQNLPHLLLHTSHEEEEHPLLPLPLSLKFTASLLGLIGGVASVLF